MDRRGRGSFLGPAVLGLRRLVGLAVRGGCRGGGLLAAVPSASRASARLLLRLRRLLVGRLRGLCGRLFGPADLLSACRPPASSASLFPALACGLRLRLLGLRLRCGLLDLLLARSARRLLGLGLGGDRDVVLLRRRLDERRVGGAVRIRSTRTLTFLPTRFAASATAIDSPSSFPTPALMSCSPTSTSSSLISAPSSTGAFGAMSTSLPSSLTLKWSTGTPALPSRKKRRLASASISVSRDAPGPIRCEATFSSSSTRSASTPRFEFRGKVAQAAARRRSRPSASRGRCRLRRRSGTSA